MSIYTVVKKCVLCFNKSFCISDIFGESRFLPDNRHAPNASEFEKFSTKSLKIKRTQIHVSIFIHGAFLFKKRPLS